MAAILKSRQPNQTNRNQSRTNVRKIKYAHLTWYDFAGLGEADYRYLQRNFKFHPLDFEDLRSTRQRPKLDEYPDYLFIIFHVPFYDRRTKRIVQEEVDLFIGQDFFVTTHSGRLKVIHNLFEQVRTNSTRREEYMGKGSGFLLYELMSRLFEHSFPMLDRIADRIDEVEHEIFEGRSKEMVQEISQLKLEIINFRRIIRPQRVLIPLIEDKKKRFLPENLEIYFDDVEDTIGRTNDLLDNYKEVVESLEDTNETFIQHRTNNVVKMLTYISLLTLPMASISGLMAMNIRYPFAVDAQTFWLVIIVSGLIASVLFAFMFWKRWI